MLLQKTSMADTLYWNSSYCSFPHCASPFKQNTNNEFRPTTRPLFFFFFFIFYYFFYEREGVIAFRWKWRKAFCVSGGSGKQRFFTRDIYIVRPKHFAHRHLSDFICAQDGYHSAFGYGQDSIYYSKAGVWAWWIKRLSLHPHRYEVYDIPVKSHNDRRNASFKTFCKCCFLSNG